MFLIEAIIALSILMVILSVGLLLLKFAFAVAVLPFKLLFFLTKGLLALILIVPLLLIIGTLVTAVLPLAALLFLLPVVILGGVVFALVGG